jgi:hypothetical protein
MMPKWPKHVVQRQRRICCVRQYPGKPGLICFNFESAGSIRAYIYIYIYIYINWSSWPESISELYRPSDRRLSAKIIRTFAERVPRGQRDGSLWPYSRLYVYIGIVLFITQCWWDSISTFTTTISARCLPSLQCYRQSKPSFSAIKSLRYRPWIFFIWVRFGHCILKFSKQEVISWCPVYIMQRAPFYFFSFWSVFCVIFLAIL